MESNQIDKLSDAKHIEFYKQAVHWTFKTSTTHDKSIIGVSIALIFIMTLYLVPSINYWHELFIFSVSLIGFCISSISALAILNVNKDYLIASVTKDEPKTEALSKKLDKLDLIVRVAFFSAMVFFAILAISNTAVKLIA